VAVVFALARQLFGVRVAIIAAGITAVLFWPVFYSRLALRAISLPVFSGLSAVFWWRAWREGGRETRRQGDWETRRQGDWETGTLPVSQSPGLLVFFLSGLFAGLSLHTYLAARALPIFYGLFLVYLAIFHGRELKARWRGVVVFGVVFTAVVVPLAWFLWQNPGAEFRVAEVAAPLNALRAGDFGPVLQNGLKIAGMFGFTGRAPLAGGYPRPAGLWATAGALFLWRRAAECVALAGYAVWIFIVVGGNGRSSQPRHHQRSQHHSHC
jgi:4-amino-4-deoxy-L-arabinose transferase-like glycosyltransferase